MDIDPTLPPIEVAPTTVACPGHGEHLRANWPSGFAVFSLTILHALLANEDFMRECGWREGRSADVAKINGVLAKRPACYFVGRAEIRKALMECGIGRIGLCLVCGRSGLGGRYSVLELGAKVEREHVCFECALDTGERIHAAHPAGGVWHGA